MVRRRRRATTAAAAPNATTRTIAVTAGQGEPVDVSAAVGAARTSLTGGSEADDGGRRVRRGWRRRSAGRGGCVEWVRPWPRRRRRTPWARRSGRCPGRRLSSSTWESPRRPWARVRPGSSRRCRPRYRRPCRRRSSVVVGGGGGGAVVRVRSRGPSSARRSAHRSCHRSRWRRRPRRRRCPPWAGSSPHRAGCRTSRTARGRSASRTSTGWPAVSRCTGRRPRWAAP